jgi:hypothetical protein
MAQTLLRFQANTITAMYLRIGEALTLTAAPGGADARHPRDYLLFLTLANREPYVHVEAVDTTPPHVQGIADAFGSVKSEPREVQDVRRCHSESVSPAAVGSCRGSGGAEGATYAERVRWQCVVKPAVPCLQREGCASRERLQGWLRVP